LDSKAEEDPMRLLFLFTLVAMAISPGDAMAKPASAGFKIGELFPNLVWPSVWSLGWV
jgi:hypothetical protein